MRQDLPDDSIGRIGCEQLIGSQRSVDMACDIYTNEMYQGVDLCLEDCESKKNRNQQMRDARLYGY